MSRRFRAAPGGRGPNDPWFRLGSLDVNTTMLVVVMTVAMFVVFAVEPVTKPFNEALVLYPDDVLRGQFWRVVTWPFAYPAFPGISFWSVLTLFFFWYFGNDLETNDLGRVKMLQFLIVVVLVLGLLWVGLAALLPLDGPLYSLGSVEIIVLLAWIAEHPQRRFMFNVPAWLFGVVIVGIQVLQLLGYRDWFELLNLLLGIVLCALVARALGLLSAYSWLPSMSRSRRPRRSRRQGRSTTSGPTVVVGPWEPQPSKHQARMDALLDKIHASGTESLTDAERRELLELRDILRGN